MLMNVLKAKLISTSVLVLLDYVEEMSVIILAVDASDNR